MVVFSSLPRAELIVLWAHSCASALGGAASLDRKGSGRKRYDLFPAWGVI
jgi:hypothetical protein